MKKYSSKSIRTVLNEHRDEIFALANNPKQLRAKVNELLEDKDLVNNESVGLAKIILNNIPESNQNHYLSTLMTYMTGQAVGR